MKNNQLKEEQKQAKAEAAKERIKNMWKDKNAFDEAGLWSRMFFNWTEPMLKYAKENQVDVNDLGNVRHADSVEVMLLRLEAHWEVQKMVKDNENGLAKAVLNTFKREYLIAAFWNLVVTVLQLAMPFLLQWIIQFI